MLDTSITKIKIKIRRTKENTIMIVLRQKEYARRDYEGLTNSEKEALRKKRAALAKEEFGKYRKAVDSAEKYANWKIANLKAAGDSLDKDYVKKEILDIKNNVKKDRMDYARKAIQAIDPKKEDLRWEAYKNHNRYNYMMGQIGNWDGRTKKILKDIDRECEDEQRRKHFLKRVEEYKAAKAKTRALVPINNQAEQAEQAAKKGFKLGKKGKIGLAAVGTSLAAGGAYAGYKYYKNKNKNKKD
jgi:hypothetical protein